MPCLVFCGISSVSWGIVKTFLYKLSLTNNIVLLVKNVSGKILYLCILIS